MTHTPPPEPDELILSMLREVLARQAQQMGLGQTPLANATPPPAAPPVPAPVVTAAPPPVSPPAPEPVPPTPAAEPIAAPLSADEQPLSFGERARLDDYETRAAEPVSATSLPAILRTIVIGLFGLLLLINLPVFNGVALARALPDRQSLIVRDGLVLKGDGPEIYVLEDNQKRWISSLDAFEHYGYSWEDVRVVDDTFLAQFPDGRPVHVLLKCPQSPHIYRLENDLKRWIKDIPTFLAEGHEWEDVRIVKCGQLRAIPDGDPIPPDAGPPPDL
jgi:hypothetical protein